MAILKQVSTQSEIPVYLQIQRLVKHAVASKTLQAGSRLPSVRELSEMLQLNPNTIAKAYRELELLGMVETYLGKGVFVSQKAISVCTRDTKAELADRLRSVAELAVLIGETSATFSSAAGAAYDKASANQK
jgi:GntR family transcriptional regulator